MDATIVEVALEEAREKMHKMVLHTQSEFAGFRTGRASSGLVERLSVEYYGTDVPLIQLAGFSIPEARVLVITPYDKGALSSIERAIQASDLGINPSNDGSMIRLVFPPLTEERRKELVKQVRSRAEEGRVGIRNHRRSARHEIEQAEKRHEINQDLVERGEKELDKLTADSIAEIDRMLDAKEKELMEV